MIPLFIAVCSLFYGGQLNKKNIHIYSGKKQVNIETIDERRLNRREKRVETDITKINCNRRLNPFRIEGGSEKGGSRQPRRRIGLSKTVEC